MVDSLSCQVLEEYVKRLKSFIVDAEINCTLASKVSQIRERVFNIAAVCIVANIIKCILIIMLQNSFNDIALSIELVEDGETARQN